jgi:hypothetical protein
MSTLYETITPLSVGMFKIRVWRQEEVAVGNDPGLGTRLLVSNEDLIALSDTLVMDGVENIVATADRFLALDRVNAVEVTSDGYDVVVRKQRP